MKKFMMFGIALGAAAVLTGCGGPEGAVNSWKKAIKKGDKAAADKVTVSDLHDTNENYIKWVQDGKDRVKYLDTIETKDVIKVKKGDKEKTYVVGTMRVESKAKLKKVDGKWVVIKP